MNGNRESVVENLAFQDVDREILRTLSSPGRLYWAIVMFLALGVIYGASVWTYQILTGLGVAGHRPPAMWVSYLVNFVFWIGIAHSGTLISAILFLFRARWRTGISRAAEAMTIFAVMVANLFVLIHLGRVWLVYWVIPYPNQRFLWPDFQSPLVFDFLAVSTYFTVSLFFWYTGLVPDLASVRDQASGIRRKIYGFFSLGWTGTHNQWHHYGSSYLLLAGLATPLVISVHSVVSWDFALGIIPGYHSTIFAPYFVAGAIHSGLAMALTLLIPLRRIFHFEKIITMDTLEMIAKTSILMACIVGYAYIIEYFMAWYSGNTIEKQTFMFRVFGHYGWAFWVMCFGNVIAPLFFFVRRVRRNLVCLFVIAILINIGMWLERFVIIIGSMTQDFLPYQWGFYWPNWVEVSIGFGTACLFFLLFFLFAKFVPSVAIAEVKEEVGAPRAGCREVPGSPRKVDGRTHAGGYTGHPTKVLDSPQVATGEQGALAIFAYVDDMLRCLRRLKENNCEIRSVFSPLRMREVQEILGMRPSIVRFTTLLGGILGGTGLVGLAVYAHLSYKLITGGKPVFPWIPWVIVCFEGTILMSVVFSVITWILKGRLPRIKLGAGYDPRFSHDRFGILVGTTALEREEIMQLLREAGAEEVRYIAA